MTYVITDPPFDTNTMNNRIMPEAMTILLFDDSFTSRNTWRCLPYFYTFNNFINVALDMIPKKSAEEKFTAVSIAEEEPFNHHTENMEVFLKSVSDGLQSFHEAP